MESIGDEVRGEPERREGGVESSTVKLKTVITDKDSKRLAIVTTGRH